MRTRLGAVGAIAGPIVVLAATAAPALATPTESAQLDCGAVQYEVTGFGRGQVLHVVGSTSTFVVTFAQLASGRVVFDNPGLADARDVVTCTTTSPVTGTSFMFRGFFTPRG
jgi:hypothetical protein